MSAPQPFIDFASALEKATTQAMDAGLTNVEVYHLVGTFIGYAAANHPKACPNSIANVIQLVVSSAWETAATRLKQDRGTVQ